MTRRQILAAVAARALQAQGKTIPIESGRGLDLIQVSAKPEDYKGRKALHVKRAAGVTGENAVALLKETTFSDGIIEVELAGFPGEGASGQARGFIGIAFRVQPQAEKYECFYLRPTNGRAEDQVRRNHSVQYVSHPDFPWPRLRKEFPEMYESYADLEPGIWTKVKIEVRGVKARLYVHGAAQPCLIVNDLKHGPAAGAVALWVGPGTEGYFSNLRISS